MPQFIVHLYKAFKTIEIDVEAADVEAAIDAVHDWSDEVEGERVVAVEDWKGDLVWTENDS